MSVHQIVAAGNYVHFEKDNSHVYNYNIGFRTIMDEVNRQYAFDMWVPNLGNVIPEPPKRYSGRYDALESFEEENEQPFEPFQRQENGLSQNRLSQQRDMCQSQINP